MLLAWVHVLAATFFALSVFAQRHHGHDSVPNTFITVTSSTPATSPSTGSLSTPSSAIASSPAAYSSASVSSSISSGSINTSLIPAFGITAGIKATDGTANCIGDAGKDIPCDCPPAQATFASAVEDFVASGEPFPSGDSVADQLTRLETCIVTLQNFVGGAGSGVGCPAVSTTWKELQTQLQSEE